MNKKKTFWPYGITLSLVACVLACAYTIYVCLDYPVYEDNGKFAKYQEVDDKINDMEAAQSAFEAAFGAVSFELLADGVPVSEEMKMRKKRMIKAHDINASFEILAKTAASAGKINAYLTRPDTNKFDREIKAEFSEDGVKTKKFSVDKKGRWQLKLKIDASDEKAQKVGIYDFEFFAK